MVCGKSGTEKLSIAFSSTTFLRGGAEQRMANLMKSLSSSGHDVCLIAGHDVGWVDVPQIRTRRCSLPVLGSIVDFISLLLLLARKRDAFDVIIFNGYIPAIAGIIARRLSGSRARLIKISYGPEPGHLNAAERGVKHRIIRLAYRRCDAVVTPSRWAYDYVRRIFGVDSAVIPIGIDIRRFDPRTPAAPRKAFGASKADIITLYVGHMMKRKGLDDLLQAAVTVAGKHRNAKFVFVGNSWYRQNVEEKKRFIRESGIEGNVFFAGEVDNMKLPGYYAACDIFCLPSWEESLGIVFLEAMAMQKPVVAARISAVPEVVRDGETGLLVDIRNPRMLAEALGKLIASRKLRTDMGKRGRRIVGSEFTIEKETERFLKLFYSLAG